MRGGVPFDCYRLGAGAEFQACLLDLLASREEDIVLTYLVNPWAVIWSV